LLQTIGGTIIFVFACFLIIKYRRSSILHVQPCVDLIERAKQKTKCLSNIDKFYNF